MEIISYDSMLIILCWNISLLRFGRFYLVGLIWFGRYGYGYECRFNINEQLFLKKWLQAKLCFSDQIES